MSAVCQTHFFSCCWTEWSCPRLGKTFEKVNFGKTVERAVNCTSRPEGAGTTACKRLDEWLVMSSLEESNLRDHWLTMTCQSAVQFILLPAPLKELFSSSAACLNWVIELVPLQPGSGTFWLRCCTEHNEMCMEQHLLHCIFPTYVQTRTRTGRGSLPTGSTILKEQQCLRGRIKPAY